MKDWDSYQWVKNYDNKLKKDPKHKFLLSKQKFILLIIFFSFGFLFSKNNVGFLRIIGWLISSFCSLIYIIVFWREEKGINIVTKLVDKTTKVKKNPYLMGHSLSFVIFMYVGWLSIKMFKGLDGGMFDIVGLISIICGFLGLICVLLIDYISPK